MWFGSPTRKLKPHSAIKVLASLEGQWDGEPRGQGGEKQGKKSLLPPTLVGKGVYRREAWDRHWPVGSTMGRESGRRAAQEQRWRVRKFRGPARRTQSCHFLVLLKF